MKKGKFAVKLSLRLGCLICALASLLTPRLSGAEPLALTRAADDAFEYLIISDIDDTVKESRTQIFLAALNRSFRTSVVFPEMPKVMRDLKATFQAPVIYVSTAPKFLLNWIHGAFLRIHSFPVDGIYLRDRPTRTRTFKYRTILGILQRYRPRRVIFLGDNVKHDEQIYLLFVQHFPEIDFRIFIRDARRMEGRPVNTYYSGITYVTNGNEIFASLAAGDDHFACAVSF